MEKVDTIALSITDLVFEHRNKSYGAYQLRTTHKKYLQKATVIGVTAFCLVLAVLWNAFSYSPTDDGTVYDPADGFPLPPPPTEELAPPPLPPPPAPKQIESIDFREMHVATAEEADPQEEITRIEDIGEKEISNITQDGDLPPGDLMVDPNANNTGVGELLNKPEDVIFTAVEQMPQFPDLSKFLSKNLRFPSAAQQKGVSGVVYVSFIINSQGEVKDITLAKGIDEDCDKEALRVVGKMPNWKPGRQNGQAVSVRFTLPIRFSITQQ